MRTSAQIARAAAIGALASAPFAQPISADTVGSYDLRMDCSSRSVAELELALTIPNPDDPGVLPPVGGFVFGGGPGCTPTSCAGVPVGLTVDPDCSYSIRADEPGMSGAAPDAVYFRFVGTYEAASNQRVLCHAGDDVFLARIEVDHAPPEGSDLAVQFDLSPAVAFTSGYGATPGPMDGVFLREPGMGAGCEDAGGQLAYSEWVYDQSSGDADVRVRLSPALNDASGLEWLVDLDTALEVQQLTVGFVAAPGAGLGDILFQGCPPQPHGGETPCHNQPDGTIGTTVRLSESKTQGPGASPEPEIREDALYVTLTGDIDLGNGESTLATIPPSDPDGRSQVSLGVVQLVNGGTPGEPPFVTFEGAAQAQGTSSAIVFPGGGAGDDDDLHASVTGAGNEDSDGDGWQDDTDNCPYAFNPNQGDAGGFGGPPPDLIGDLCQCGDVTPGTAANDYAGDGWIDQEDVPELLRILTGEAEATAVVPEVFEQQERRCSVTGDGACDIFDGAVLELAVEGASGSVPNLDGGCVNATPQGLETN